MKKLKKYCDKQKKILEKMMKKLFGYTYIECIREESDLRTEFEEKFSKDIDNITWTDVKNFDGFPKKYAKYKTVRVLVDTYLNVQRIYTFTNDYEGEING